MFEASKPAGAGPLSPYHKRSERNPAVLTPTPTTAIAIQNAAPSVSESSRLKIPSPTSNATANVIPPMAMRQAPRDQMR
jgi:hypothetical protein